MIGSQRGVPCRWDAWAGPGWLSCWPEGAEHGRLGWRSQMMLCCFYSCAFHVCRDVVLLLNMFLKQVKSCMSSITYNVPVIAFLPDAIY